MKKTTGLKTLGRRIIACACSAALGVALLPAAAFAAGGGSGSGSSSAPVIVSVVMKDAQTGSEIELKKGKYTQANLDAMAAENTDPKAYVYNTTVLSTTSYVTLDQLLSVVPATRWAEGSTVTFQDSSSPDPFTGNGAISYEDATATQYYYPEGTKNGPSGKAEETGIVLALNEATSPLENKDPEIESTAADVVNSFTTASYTTEKAPRVCFGVASGDASTASYPKGKGFVSGVSKITVTYPHEAFQVLARDSETNEETTIATYTDEQLAELAKANSGNVSYLYKSGVYTATSYVTINQLIGNDDHWLSSSSFEVNTPDNFAYKVTYDQATAKGYFYPEYTTAAKSAAGAVEVEPIIALSYKAGSLSLGTTTAQDAATESLTQDDASGAPRFLMGNTSADNILAGNTTPQNVCKVTIFYKAGDYYKAEYEKATTALKAAEQKVASTQTSLAKANSELKAAQAKVTTLQKTLTSVTVNAKTVNAAAVASAIEKAGGNAKYVKTITIGKKAKKISKSAFKATKATKLIVKTTKLKKKSAKGSLKGSKVKTVQVPSSKKSAYKKIFTKANAGKKVTVK